MGIIKALGLGSRTFGLTVTYVQGFLCSNFAVLCKLNLMRKILKRAKIALLVPFDMCENCNTEK